MLWKWALVPFKQNGSSDLRFVELCGAKVRTKAMTFYSLFAIKGHLFDPMQLKWYAIFKTAYRQLTKHVHLRSQWEKVWMASVQARSQYKNGKTNMVGPASMFHIACHQLDLKWTEPFVIIFPLLTIPYQYFLHLIRYAIARALWKRAAASRKTLKGIQVGIDKKTTTE